MAHFILPFVESHLPTLADSIFDRIPALSTKYLALAKLEAQLAESRHRLAALVR